MKKEKKVNNAIENESKLPKSKRTYEISPESYAERTILSLFLLDKTAELIKERNSRLEKIEVEKIELRSGDVISRLQIKQFVSHHKLPYEARFPNENRFFKNMFRLHPKLENSDPEKFQKPPLSGKLLKQLIYDRFPIEFAVEVLPALRVLAMPGGFRLFNCHEYLTHEGVQHLIRFRDEANEMMDKYQNRQWYDFKKEYSKTYKLPFQPELF